MCSLGWPGNETAAASSKAVIKDMYYHTRANSYFILFHFILRQSVNMALNLLWSGGHSWPSDPPTCTFFLGAGLTGVRHHTDYVVLAITTILTYVVLAMGPEPSTSILPNEHQFYPFLHPP